MDGLPKALLTKMTVLSTVQSDCRSLGLSAAAIHEEAKEGNVQDRATSTEPSFSSEMTPRSPGHQMYVDHPAAERALGRSAAAAAKAATASKVSSHYLFFLTLSM